MTYSIVGRDAETGDLGVGAQSQAFNTGAAVSWAWAGVGAVATQSLTDRRYGWSGLELIAAGAAPQDALARLRSEDPLVEFRQVGMMSADGRTAQWTGANCVPDAGGVGGDGWIAQANMVESPGVWEAMGAAFKSAEGSLAERLMSALEAAELKAATGGGGAARRSSSCLPRGSAGSGSSICGSRKAMARWSSCVVCSIARSGIERPTEPPTIEKESPRGEVCREPMCGSSR